MPSTRFKYNPETCRYEPFYVKGKVLRNRTLLFLGISFVIALCGYFGYVSELGSIEELFLKERNVTLKLEWEFLNDRLTESHKKLGALIEKDDQNYRVILDTHPLSPEIREAGIGGSEKIDMSSFKDYPSIVFAYKKIEKLKHKIDIEKQSFAEIDKMLSTKLMMWSSKPAIQPVSNTDLTQLHLVYGSRFHPLLGYVRDHKGLDFSADIGTPVYATGDGKVIKKYFSGSYGNVIFLDHNYGYETRYAHLSGFDVQEGQRVKRGEIIGYVGNTGLSSGPHLHYEVLFNGEHTNPINFFQRDLSNKEYERLIEEGSKHTYSLD